MHYEERIMVNNAENNMKPYHTFAIALVLCAFVTRAHAQCPLNIDFGLGNWQCYRGSTSSSGNNNVITVSPTVNVHKIVSRGTLKNPYGGFSTSPHGGGGYSVKLCNDDTGAEAERISYQFTVPATQKKHCDQLSISGKKTLLLSESDEKK
ncbi:hypothetical protein BDD43_6048 [Mucilaginibacter gracilis]|uniref:Uncharacterized protein n=1 Tax=Mucilaginibacter gracilis TaxID=423350 RepID=A0A495JBM9_9SPHI|nr:hypothetical protein [Mucilaginibacter gracilis]RKR85772.1 hypothetical protein BDD43_6048 [Mucilaginibacter gracilis]